MRSRSRRGELGAAALVFISFYMPYLTFSSILSWFLVVVVYIFKFGPNLIITDITTEVFPKNLVEMGASIPRVFPRIYVIKRVSSRTIRKVALG